MGRRHHSHSMDGLLGGPLQKASRRRPQSRSVTWLVRAAFLYIVYMFCIGCPAVLRQKDPAICHRYYALKRIATQQIAPHLEPYYHEYAAPVVAKGLPYYQQANAAYAKVEDAARPVVQSSYDFYTDNIHPHVARSWQNSVVVFDDKVGRHVYKIFEDNKLKARQMWYQNVGRRLDRAELYYNQYIAPHQASAQNKVNYLWFEVVIPGYRKAWPHVVSAADLSVQQYRRYMQPALRRVVDSLLRWLKIQVLPVIRRYYYLYIDPQVSRITDKVFQFQAERGMSSQTTIAQESLTASISSSLVHILSTTTMTPITTVIAEQTLVAEAADPSASASLQRLIQETAAERLAEHAKAGIRAEADVALPALEEQLDDILPSLVRTERMICEDYLLQLEDLSVSAVGSVERRIISQASHLTNKGRALDEISEELRPYFVRAGKSIHREAVELRSYLHTVLEKLDARIQRSVSPVHDGIQHTSSRLRRAAESALQSQGQEQLSEQRIAEFERLTQDVDQELQNLVRSKTKLYTKQLQELLKHTEHKVEALAGDAARKLQALHSVAPHKINMNDRSEEFGYGYKPVAAMLSARALYEQASAKIVGTEDVPAASKLVDSAADAMRHATDAVADAFDYATPTSIASAAVNNAASGASVAAAALAQTLRDIDLKNVASSASATAADLSAQAESAYAAVSSVAAKIDGADVQSHATEAASAVVAALSDAAAAASQVLVGHPSGIADRVVGVFAPTETKMTDKIVDVAGSLLNEAAGSATKAVEDIASYAADFHANHVFDQGKQAVHQHVIVPARDAVSSASSAVVG